MWSLRQPTYLKVDAHLEKALAQEVEGLFWRYKDVFYWTYIDFKELLPSVAPHYLELEKDVLHVHQAYYWMTVHNANIVEHDVDKLLTVGFFKPVEEAT
jgi:tRNA A37 N6-isopentenylltransferase MiaA